MIINKLLRQPFLESGIPFDSQYSRHETRLMQEAMRRYAKSIAEDVKQACKEAVDDSCVEAIDKVNIEKIISWPKHQ